ncbi:MAG TPA: hypothetical protein VGD60_07715 [Candidatus Acidoferrales bacterium]
MKRTDDPSPANQTGTASNEPMDSDEEQMREPNQPPPGLMRKRRHPAVWIAFALLLGGLIALVLAALVTS